MVSFSFKQRRFEKLHANAIRWDAEKFNYIGVDPSARLGFDLAKATKGEEENAVQPYLSDNYGCNDEILVQKRLSRNPFFTQNDYKWTNPEIAELITFCGTDDNELFAGSLPWDHN